MAKDKEKKQPPMEPGLMEKIVQESGVKAEQLEKNLKLVQERIAGLEQTKKTLSTWKDNAVNDGLIPIGSGIFFESQVMDTANVMIDIGSGVIMKKSIDETLERLDKSIAGMQDHAKKIAAERDKNVQVVFTLGRELRALQKQRQG
ncbi:MAG: prefoldin subunit alpha [Candidatus Diapherotrites archaeon]|nr:prefoldin subunit alpha [Candidatus Diapherotrites archaeon]